MIVNLTYSSSSGKHTRNSAGATKGVPPRSVLPRIGSYSGTYIPSYMHTCIHAYIDTCIHAYTYK